MCTQSCLSVSGSQGCGIFPFDLCFDYSKQVYHHRKNNLFYIEIKEQTKSKMNPVMIKSKCLSDIFFIVTLNMY